MVVIRMGDLIYFPMLWDRHILDADYYESEFDFHLSFQFRVCYGIFTHWFGRSSG